MSRQQFQKSTRGGDGVLPLLWDERVGRRFEPEACQALADFDIRQADAGGEEVATMRRSISAWFGEKFGDVFGHQKKIRELEVKVATLEEGLNEATACLQLLAHLVKM